MSNRDRVYIEGATTEINDLYINLTTESGYEPTKAFKDTREVFLAAAVLGCINNSFVPLKNRKERVLWQTLTNDPYAFPTMQMLALKRSEDPTILMDYDKVATIAEGYANGGIRILKDMLQKEGGNELTECAMSMLEFNVALIKAE